MTTNQISEEAQDKMRTELVRRAQPKVITTGEWEDLQEMVAALKARLDALMLD